MKPSLLSEVPRGDRLTLWTVFCVACSLIGLETVSFQTLVYVNEYLPATQVISVALMGIAIGGLLSYPLSKLDVSGVSAAVLALYPFSVVASLPIIIRLNPNPELMMALLTPPYILASLYISMVFNAMRPNRVYLFDLAGAGLGTLVAVISIPHLREEGSFFALALIGSLPLMLNGLSARADSKRGAARIALGALLALGSLGGLVVHLVADPFNIALTATADKEEYPDKIFWFTSPEKEGAEPRHRLMYSRGSLIERIDIGYWTRDEKRRPNRYNLITWYNGRPNDHIQRFRPRVGYLDRRLPTRLRLGDDPDTLLVGPAAEGLTKPVIALGHGRVDAVEINRAVAELMTDELYDISGQAYRGMWLTIGDVRTFLERTEREYDFITLLNTHRIRTIGQQGPPEYCHTLEAMQSYLEHLKPGGYVVLEERNVNERADLGIKRFLRTALRALESRGAEDPARHVAVYEFFTCKKKVWFTDRSRCRRGGRYTMVLISPTPISQRDYEHFVKWGEDLGERVDRRKGLYRGIEWMYLPQDRRDNDWTETILASSVEELDFFDPAEHTMGVITDDRPFPYDVFLAREKQWEVLESTALLSLLMVLLPAIVTFLARRRNGSTEVSPGRRAGLNLLLVAYFAILGIGYLLIEIVLMQKFQMFLSSPVFSLAVVLGAMLIASGVGGYYSGRVGRRGALLALALVVVLSAVCYLALDPILSALMFLPFAARIAVAILLIAPLAFAMGMPFPFAMELSKKTLSDRHAGLFFGINGAFAAVATPLSIIISMTRGFNFTILVGGAAYVLCLFLLAAARDRRDAAGARSKATSG
jgi:hypothetical protein